VAGILPIVGTFAPADRGTTWTDQAQQPGGPAQPIADGYDPADFPDQFNAQATTIAPDRLNYHGQGMSNATQDEVSYVDHAAGSWGAPLVSERARGIDSRHARASLNVTYRPWETDYGADAFGWLGGNHIVFIPGAQESRGVLAGNVLNLPQPLTTRVPPARWDDPTRKPAETAAVTGL
jgi:hypothetical protein